ncbi:MAG TPA: undecaprenyl-phosphate glucose phosphotransferase [Herpetosiphonaceae bacterium]|nr:undecaprenyl-phosphate glucose phosphotransferase [Herpetosiphonaceae bacterium]
MRLSPRAVQTAALIACDVVGVNAGFVGSYLLLYESQIARTWQPPELNTALVFLLLLNLACALIFSVYRLYAIRRAGSRVDEAYKVFVAITIATLVASVIGTITNLRFTTWNLVAAWLLAVFLVVLLRNIVRSLVYHARTRGFDRARAVIIGTGATGRMIADVIGRGPHLGYEVQGFLSDDAPIGSKVAGQPVLGRPRDILRVVRACRINEILVTLPGAPSDQILEIVAACENEPVSIKIYPDTFQIITNNEVSLGDLEGLPLLSIKSSPLDLQFNRWLKRGLDLLGAAAGLILLSPVMLVIALLVRLDSPGSVIFVQERVGFNGEPFKMFKFRSMRAEAEATGPGWTRPDDDRRTRMGEFIRRYSLDELPQLINVLLGEMSLVGPRPEQPYFVEQFRLKIPRYMGRHKEKSGLTGWAQVNGLRGDTSIEERTRYDLYYVENWSLLFDIKIIVRTLATIFRRGSNAY